MRRPSRHGLGPATLGTVVMLCCLAMLAYYQNHYTTQTLRLATRDAGGAVVEELATSAIEEATAQLQRVMMDPAEPLFWKLRREILSGQNHYLDLSADLAPSKVLARLEKSPNQDTFRYLKIEYLRVIFHTPQALSHRLSGGDTAGMSKQLVDFDCVATLKLPDTVIYRRVAQRRSYGITFVAPYLPLDQVTVAFVHHSYLDRLPQDLNRLRNWFNAYNVMLRRFQPRNDPGAGSAFPVPFVPTRKPPVMTGKAQEVASEQFKKRVDADPHFKEYFEGLSADEQGWLLWRMVQAQPEGQIAPAPTVPRTDLADAPLLETRNFPAEAPPKNLMIYSVADRVNLADFDYEARWRRETERDRESLERAGETLNAAWAGTVEGGRGLSDTDTRDQMLGRMVSFAQEVRPRLDRMQRLILANLVHIGRHSRMGFSGDFLEEYLRNESHTARPVAYHVSDQPDLDKFFANFPSYSGHLSLVGAKPLVINAPAFAGKAVISSQYHGTQQEPRLVSVKEFQVKDPAKDLAILNGDFLALGSSTYDLGVFARDRLALGTNVTIRGNLAMQQLRPLEERPAGEELHGTVEYNPRLYAGLYFTQRAKAPVPRRLAMDHYVLGLLPRGMKKVVQYTREAQ